MSIIANGQNGPYTSEFGAYGRNAFWNAQRADAAFRAGQPASVLTGDAFEKQGVRDNVLDGFTGTRYCPPDRADRNQELRINTLGYAEAKLQAIAGEHGPNPRADLAAYTAYIRKHKPEVVINALARRLSEAIVAGLCSQHFKTHGEPMPLEQIRDLEDDSEEIILQLFELMCDNQHSADDVAEAQQYLTDYDVVLDLEAAFDTAIAEYAQAEFTAIDANGDQVIDTPEMAVFTYLQDNGFHALRQMVREMLTHPEIQTDDRLFVMRMRHEMLQTELDQMARDDFAAKPPDDAGPTPGAELAGTPLDAEALPAVQPDGLITPADQRHLEAAFQQVPDLMNKLLKNFGEWLDFNTLYAQINNQDPDA